MESESLSLEIDQIIVAMLEMENAQPMQRLALRIKVDELKAGIIASHERLRKEVRDMRVFLGRGGR